MAILSSELKSQFFEIPEQKRHAQQPFSVRVWRALSWLKRSEAADDMEGKLLSLWIAFNASYGQDESAGIPKSARSNWQEFLTKVSEHDRDDLLGAILREHQTDTFHLIDNQFLYRPFWNNDSGWEDKFTAARRSVMMKMSKGYTLPVLIELFDRMYLLRNQIFHGAATSGSKLNRPAMEQSTVLLQGIVPAVIAIMIGAGTEIRWGPICFPPR
jgi:hypothetical protein